MAEDLKTQATAENPEGSSIPQGEGQIAEASIAEVDAGLTDDFEPEILTEDDGDVGQEGEDLLLEDDEDSAPDSPLFAPSFRPEEPITAGASFGAGPDLPTVPDLTPDQQLNRYAKRLMANKDVPQEVRAWAARRLLGQ